MPEPRAAAAALLLALALALALALPAQASDREAYLEVATTILCDCGCHPQSVHACACGRAAEMREEIAAALLRGGPGGTPQTAAQVIASYVARHGEKIRIAPTTRGFNLVAWLGPFVGLLAAGIAVVFALRRWRAAPQPAVSAAQAGQDLDPAYLQRLQRELRDER